MRCLRCDFRTDPDLPTRSREQLADHAAVSDHPLCVVCHRSLDRLEQQTCERCLTESRALLAGIRLMWHELPGHLGQIRGTGFSPVRGGSDGRPLLGGDGMALIGPGGTGLTGRRLTPTELRRGLTQNLDGREHMVDNRPSDPASVAQLLTTWEDDWRHTRGEPASDLPAASTTRVISAAARYLEVHGRWAAREHPAFEDYFDDLRILHVRLEHATGRGDVIQRAEADCFQCGADALVRDVNARGYADSWTCRRCGEEYGWERYRLAVAERLQGTPAGDYPLPGHIALQLGLPLQTVLTWAKRGVVGTVCLLGGKRDKRMRVVAEDVKERARLLEERRRRDEQRRSAS